MGRFIARESGLSENTQQEAGSVGAVSTLGSAAGLVLQRTAQGAIGAISPLEAIPISQVERVEILRGNASAVYGPGAAGGVSAVEQPMMPGMRNMPSPCCCCSALTLTKNMMKDER